jgi:hypothetical protein
VLAILPQTFIFKVALYPIVLWQIWKCVWSETCLWRWQALWDLYIRPGSVTGTLRLNFPPFDRNYIQYALPPAAAPYEYVNRQREVFPAPDVEVVRMPPVFFCLSMRTA